MKIAAPTILVLAAGCFAIALVSTDNRSMDELAGTSWDLVGIETPQGPEDAAGLEQVLVFPKDGRNRFTLENRCGTTNVFYKPNGLGGDVVASGLTGSGDCPTTSRVNVWTPSTRFWLLLDGESLTLRAEINPDVEISDNLTHLYTRGP